MAMQGPLAAYWIMLLGAIMPYPLVIMAKANRDYDKAIRAIPPR